MGLSHREIRGGEVLIVDHAQQAEFAGLPPGGSGFRISIDACVVAALHGDQGIVAGGGEVDGGVASPSIGGPSQG